MKHGILSLFHKNIFGTGHSFKKLWNFNFRTFLQQKIYKLYNKIKIFPTVFWKSKQLKANECLKTSLIQTEMFINLNKRVM